MRNFRVVGFVLFLLLTGMISCSPPIWNKLQKRAAGEQGIYPIQEHQLLAVGDFSEWWRNWEEESEIPAQIRFLKADSSLDIIAPKGFTLWYKKPFEGNLTYQYQIRALSGTDSLNRCSDLNCFWMATDPLHPDSIFARKSFRGGVFGRTYSLSMYYLGFGGNGNTTTRFRKYDGDYEAFLQAKKRPEVLKEYTDSNHLIKPDHWYTVVISIRDGQVKCWWDNELLIQYSDTQPLTKGWFGFRTTQNHLQVRNFTVSKP